MTLAPHWITPAGLLCVAAELLPVTVSVAASGNDNTYKLISGHLPTGLSLNATGEISGTPATVVNLVRSKFVVRVTNAAGIADRTFFIDVDGADDPIWDGDSQYLKVGINGERYAMYNQWIDYPLAAAGSRLNYYLASGALPPGLTIDSSGRIRGYLGAPLTNPTPHAPVAYQFKITATGGTFAESRSFKILSVHPNMMRASTPLLPSKFGVLSLSTLPSSVSFLQPLQWIDRPNLGTVHTGGQVNITAAAYDPAPRLGPVTYSMAVSGNAHAQLPPGLILAANTGIISGTLPHQTTHAVAYSVTITGTKLDTATGAQVRTTRTFDLIVDGSDDTAWNEDVAFLKVGINLERWAMLNQWVDYSLPTSATDYQVSSGQLPPGLTLNTSGRLSGIVRAGTTPLAVTHEPVIYSFAVTNNTVATDYKILVIDPNMMRSDTPLLPDAIDSMRLDILPASVSYLQPVQWINSIDVGIIDNTTPLNFSVAGYDPAPETGPVTYSIRGGANTMNRLPMGVTIDAATGRVHGMIEYPYDVTRLYSLTVVATKVDSTSGDTIRSTNTFSMTIRNAADDQVWNVDTEYLKVGLHEERWAMTNQWIDCQISAHADEAPTATQVQYYLADRSGHLPPGLTLSSTGRISGFLRDRLDTTQPAHWPKIYQFTVTATDQVSQEACNFRILAVSPDTMRADTPWLPNNISVLRLDQLSDSISYLQPPQWLNGHSLGTIRANNNQGLNVIAYDPAPILGPVTYSITQGDNLSTQLPTGLVLDTATGYITGFIPYQPAVTRTYSLTIHATKTDKVTGETAQSTGVFSLVVKGAVDAALEWITVSNLGRMTTGMISELHVAARQVHSTYAIKYQLAAGQLPPGLTLAQDGSITGKINYGASGTYSFTVQAMDVCQSDAITREFTIAAIESSKEYTDIYVKPFLPQAQRTAYEKFTADEFTFDPQLLYRYYDSNFGVQHDIKMTLEFGIEVVTQPEYSTALYENFYRKQLYFGDVKVAIARDSHGVPVYEVVYVDIVDPMINANGSVSPVLYENNDIYYPSSIDTMRYQLHSIVVPDNQLISIDEFHRPQFMRTPQAGSYQPPGYVRVVPVCYALPGQGARIVSRIKLSGFDFKMINFTVDRLVVQTTADSTTARYLIIPRQSIGSSIPTDHYLVGADGQSLDDENHLPLLRE